MDGIRPRGLALWLVLTWCGATTVGCDRSQSSRATTPTTPSSEEAPPRPSRPSRGEVSCHLHSCAPPKYCNRDSGVCELVPCNASRDCPYGYKCDFARNVCQ